MLVMHTSGCVPCPAGVPRSDVSLPWSHCSSARSHQAMLLLASAKSALPLAFDLASAEFALLPLVPALASQIGLVSGVLAYNFGPSFAAVTLATVAAYVAFTFSVTQVLRSLPTLRESVKLSIAELMPQISLLPFGELNPA